MKLTYYIDSKEEKTLEIKSSDFLSNGEKVVKVLAVVDEAIITEVALNPSWSNRVFSAQQVHDLGYAKVA